uniref:Ninja-family protein n=1 Tax=Nelumbo nucifera TaxID=4432 RepID=A0A822Z290_NELNU|nr:TPA_asm: hypothetical protein HUJ06_006248 [Nelumbo nucifera]
MEDENGIVLSLGLSCGGFAGKSKGKDGGSSDSKTDEGGNSNKLMGDFKDFLHTGIQKQDLDNGSKKSDLMKTQENFFTSLAKSTPETCTSVDLNGNNVPQFTRYGGLWSSNSNMTAEAEEEKSDHHETGGKLWAEAGNKRKMLFEDVNHQKKHESEVQYADGHGKNPPKAVLTPVRSSHVSLTTEDGSTAENEDVAESEAEGSTSRLAMHHEDGTKLYMGGGSGSSEVPKEGHVLTDSPSVIDVQGKKQSNVPLGNESKIGNMTYGIPFSLQPLTVMTVPYSVPVKVPNPAGAPNTSGISGPCMMQLMPPANNERPGGQQMNSGTLPFTFGYSPVQLPTLETDQPWGMVSHAQQFPPFAGRSTGGVTLNSDKSEDGIKVTQALLYDAKASELAKGSGKQHTVEEGGASSSSQTEDEVKGNSTIFRPKEASDQPIMEGFPQEGSAIRPGLAAGLKFGGCGSYPDLPWVSTTGTGPNGRTISGVTYRYNKNQIRIVCACHGSHMSPEEFIQHANADNPNPENNSGLPSYPSSNPAASAQS